MSNLIELSKGNTYRLTYTILDPNTGEPKNLSNTSVLKFSLAKNSRSAPVLTLVRGEDTEISILSPTEGTLVIILRYSALNTIPPGRYYYEVWHQDTNGDPTTLVSEQIVLHNKLIIG